MLATTQLFKLEPKKKVFASLKACLEDELIINSKCPIVTIFFKRYSSNNTSLTLVNFADKDANDEQYLLLNDEFISYFGDSFEKTLKSSFSLEASKKGLTFKGILCEDERLPRDDSLPNCIYHLLGHLSHGDSVESVIYACNYSIDVKLPLFDVDKILNSINDGDVNDVNVNKSIPPFLKGKVEMNHHSLGNGKTCILDLLSRSLNL